MQTNSNLISDITINAAGIDLTVPRQHLPLQPHQIELLKQACPMFLPCRDIVSNETAVKLTYEKNENHVAFTQIKQCTQTEKILILLKTGKFLTETNRRHSTSFDPHNIVFSHTYDIAFLLRILPGTPIARSSHEEFEEYKALVLSVLQNKYTFEQIVQYGADILAKDPLCVPIVKTQTPEELEALLTDMYMKNYHNARHKRIAFSTKTVKLFSYTISFLIAGLICTLAYFVYTNITETRTYGNKMYIYENYYNRNPLAVVEYADKLSEKDMDTSLKRVVADALIATNEPENLKRAFALDNTRQIEIIEKLIALQQDDLIATLSSDNHLAQLYQAYYAKDYQRAITLAQSSADLRYNAQAQILLAKVYVAMNDYVAAETILKGLGDPDALLEVYKEHREAVLNNEQNIELRQKLLKELDDIIKLMEDVKKAESDQGTTKQATQKQQTQSQQTQSQQNQS